MNLLIPALAISGAIVTGSPIVNEYDYQREADAILETHIYKYYGEEVYAAHNPGIFSRLPEIKKNSLVIINNERFRVKGTDIIKPHEVEKAFSGTTLFSCINGIRDRFVVYLK